MEPVAAVRAASNDAAQTTSTTTTSSTKPAKDFASYLKAGEKLEQLPDHKGYEKIQGGTRDGEYLNTSGNKRNGEAFKIADVHGKVYHVYGKLLVLVGRVDDKAKTTTTASTPTTSTASAPTGTTSTPTASTGTASTGATTTGATTT